MEVTMKISRIVSLFVALALFLSCAVSCMAPDAKALLDEATAAMAETPYTLTMNMSFSSDNTEIDALLSAMSVKDMKVDVDGDDIHFKMDMDAGIVKTEMEYTVVSGMIYMKMIASAYGYNETVKQKAAINEQQLDEFMSEMQLSQNMDIADFVEIDLTTSDGAYVISCSGVTEKLNEAFDEMMSGALESMGDSIKISNAAYEIKIKDKKIDSARLTFTCNLTVNGEEIEFSMISNMNYDYEGAVSISAPSDASSYKEIDYSALIGK